MNIEASSNIPPPTVTTVPDDKKERQKNLAER
jgi:hypothetical protein